MLYLVKIPSDAQHPTPDFVRAGKPTTNLVTAMKRAHRHNGRVYSYDGETKLVEDFWTAPEPEPINPGSREYRQQRAMAALFGILA